MTSKTRALSAGLVVCGWFLFASGFAVAYLIAQYPKGASFYWDYVPTYVYFESISGGLPLMSLGITISIAGILIAFHERSSVSRMMKRM